MMMVSEALRRAIKTCGMTQAELSRATGVLESGISRFMAGMSEPRISTVDRLAAHLGLELTARPAKSRRKG